MPKIRTSGEMRAFLADVMVGIKSGDIDGEQAGAIAKVAAQINQSLTAEVNAVIAFKRGDIPLGVGDMSLAPESAIEAIAPGDGQWCDQCDAKISDEDAATCKSRFCSLRKPAKAMEAQRAETQSGSVHDSAVPERNLP